MQNSNVTHRRPDYSAVAIDNSYGVCSSSTSPQSSSFFASETFHHHIFRKGVLLFFAVIFLLFFFIHVTRTVNVVQHYSGDPLSNTLGGSSAGSKKTKYTRKLYSYAHEIRLEEMLYPLKDDPLLLKKHEDPFPRANHLVVVCAHAAFSEWDFARWNESSKWTFQRYLTESVEDRVAAAELAPGLVARSPKQLERIMTPADVLLATARHHIILGIRAILSYPWEAFKESESLLNQTVNSTVTKRVDAISDFLQSKQSHKDTIEALNSSILIFSGGVTGTRISGAPVSISEALSYLGVAQKERYFDIFSHILDNTTGLVDSRMIEELKTMLENRMFTEEYARDSHENLFFSVARFREITGHYPEYITLVGFNYKAERFIRLHRAALRFCIENFNVIGLDPIEALVLNNLTVDVQNPDVLVNNEVKLNPAVRNGTAIFNLLNPADYSFSRAENDIYLCEANQDTRKRLNPAQRVNPYQLSAPEMGPLLRYCSRTQIFPGEVPWIEC